MSFVATFNPIYLSCIFTLQTPSYDIFSHFLPGLKGVKSQKCSYPVCVYFLCLRNLPTGTQRILKVSRLKFHMNISTPSICKSLLEAITNIELNHIRFNFWKSFLYSLCSLSDWSKQKSSFLFLLYHDSWYENHYHVFYSGNKENYVGKKYQFSKNTKTENTKCFNV